MKLDLNDFPKHNWIIITDTSGSLKCNVKWAKIKCEDCSVVIDSYYIYGSIMENKIRVYIDKVELDRFSYTEYNKSYIKQKILSCHDMIIKKIIG